MESSIKSSGKREISVYTVGFVVSDTVVHIISQHELRLRVQAFRDAVLGTRTGQWNIGLRKECVASRRVTPMSPAPDIPRKSRGHGLSLSLSLVSRAFPSACSQFGLWFCFPCAERFLLRSEGLGLSCEE